MFISLQRSQERENSVKKISRLPLISHAREESQMQMSRPSNNLTRKWSSASGSDHRCKVFTKLNGISSIKERKKKRKEKRTSSNVFDRE